MSMKKIILISAITAILASCGKKDVYHPTASGLNPEKFISILPETKDTTGLYVLKNANGMEVCITNIGARLVSVLVPAKDGSFKNVIIGYDSILPYTRLGDVNGAVIGRYAGRIKGSQFELDRVTYRLRSGSNGKYTIHGGPRNFSTHFFKIEQPDSQTVIAKYFSKDNEEGFPGNLNFTTTYSLGDDNALNIDYEATVDRATHINITNHSFFNLSGRDAGNLDGHTLWLKSAKYLDTDESLLPTGKFVNVKGAYDFNNAKSFDLETRYDNTYVLDNNGNVSSPFAKAYSAETGISMEVFTTEPGVQLYIPGAKNSFCLETQHYPDSPNHPEFPSTILRVDSVFKSKTIYKFGVE